MFFVIVIVTLLLCMLFFKVFYFKNNKVNYVDNLTCSHLFGAVTIDRRRINLCRRPPMKASRIAVPGTLPDLRRCRRYRFDFRKLKENRCEDVIHFFQKYIIILNILYT